MRAQRSQENRCGQRWLYPTMLLVLVSGLEPLRTPPPAFLCAAGGGGSGGGNHASCGTSIPETKSAPAQRLDGIINASPEQIDFVRCAGVNRTASSARRRREAWLRVLNAGASSQETNSGPWHLSRFGSRRNGSGGAPNHPLPVTASAPRSTCRASQGRFIAHVAHRNRRHRARRHVQSNI